jgi:hypothetical protein
MGFFTVEVHSKGLTLDKVIENSKKHYPLLLNLIENKKFFSEKVNESLGAFDTQLDLSTGQKLGGYYDGDSFEAKISKPLRFLNSKIYTSYRESEGQFPLYENGQKTLNSGETKLGVSFSLWRDRSIDSKRLKLANSKLDLKKVEALNFSNEQEIQSELAQAYWDWVAKGRIYEVHKELLDFAIARNTNLKKRIKAGDLSRIYETENLQYIVKRRGKLFESLKNYLKASLMFSLFYRDSDGYPVKLKDSDLPEDLDFKVISIDLEDDLLRISKKHPKLASLKLEALQLKNDQQLSENNLNPSLDLDLSYAQNFGDPQSSFDETLEPAQTKALIKMNIPLERNLVKSKLSQVRIKKKMLFRKTRLVQDELKAKASALYYGIKNIEKIIQQAILEISYAEILVKAEIKKFEKGTSDFFVINIREQNLADAKIRKWLKINDLNTYKAQYNALTRVMK